MGEIGESVMKKLKFTAIFGAFLLGAFLTLGSLNPVQASLGESGFDRSDAKKCEKCERGDDGKMVCKPIPCP